MKLSDIVSLQSGLVLNRKEARSLEETLKVYRRLNIRALNSDNEINHEELDVFPSKELLDPAILTHPGDIVIKLFTPICPVVVTEHDSDLVIPSQLAVLRIDNGKDLILPQYLRYWLSTSEVSDLLQSLEGWQSQRTIKIGTIADLDVPILPLKEQQIISDIASTNLRRERLYRELIEEQNKLTSLNIQRIIGGKYNEYNKERH